MDIPYVNIFYDIQQREYNKLITFEESLELCKLWDKYNSKNLYNERISLYTSQNYTNLCN